MVEMHKCTRMDLKRSMEPIPSCFIYDKRIPCTLCIYQCFISTTTSSENIHIKKYSLQLVKAKEYGVPSFY